MDAEIAARNRLINLSFIIVLGLFSLLLFTAFIMLIPFASRASSNTLTLKIKVQGNRRPGDRVRAHIDFYNGPNKSNEINDAEFIYGDGALTADVAFPNNFDFNSRYALFIRPEKHTGKVFCGSRITGDQCTSPQFFFLTAGTTVDLTEHTFLGGDVAPANGKVDGADMSNIIKNLGHMNGSATDGTDINSDGITDVTDYSLAFYSLSNNAKDDPVHLTAPPAPTVTPTPTPINFPTYPPTATPDPTVTPAPTATPVPTATTVPTATPVPTDVPTPTPTVKVLNYDKIAGMVKNRPQIGCPGGTVNGCPVSDLYNKPVDKGLGWATFYGYDHTSGYNVVATVIKNRKGITFDAALKFIDNTYMVKQSDMTPEEAKKTGKVIAYGATRSPSDLWKIKYMFGISDPNNPKPYFIGRFMVIDCAASHDWNPRLATLTYSYKGWNTPPLNWLVDISNNGFTQIPTGLSGQQGNVGEGRPGVVLIDESILDDMIY